MSEIVQPGHRSLGHLDPLAERPIDRPKLGRDRAQGGRGQVVLSSRNEANGDAGRGAAADGFGFEAATSAARASASLNSVKVLSNRLASSDSYRRADTAGFEVSKTGPIP